MHSAYLFQTQVRNRHTCAFSTMEEALRMHWVYLFQTQVRNRYTCALSTMEEARATLRTHWAYLFQTQVRNRYTWPFPSMKKHLHHSAAFKAPSTPWSKHVFQDASNTCPKLAMLQRIRSAFRKAILLLNQSPCAILIQKRGSRD